MFWQSFILQLLGTPLALTDFLTIADLHQCCLTCAVSYRLGKVAQNLFRTLTSPPVVIFSYFDCISAGPFLRVNSFLYVTDRSVLSNLNKGIETLSVLCDTRCSTISRSLFANLFTLAEYLNQVQQLTLSWTCKFTLTKLYIRERTLYSLTSN